MEVMAVILICIIIFGTPTAVAMLLWCYFEGTAIRSHPLHLKWTTLRKKDEELKRIKEHILSRLIARAERGEKECFIPYTISESESKEDTAKWLSKRGYSVDIKDTGIVVGWQNYKLINWRKWLGR